MPETNVIFHPEASQEYLATYLWYYEKGIHLAESFEREVDRSIRLIVESPKRWPIYLKKIRRVLVRRFPYLLMYSVQGQTINIIAVAHAHRKPGYWRKR